MKVTVESTLAAPIGVAWEKLKRTDTLRFVAHGVMTYDADDLPTNWTVGMTVNLKPRFWGKPQGDHFVTVMSLNENDYTIITNERGGHITKWNHTMRLVETYPSQCLLIDTIEIEAGWMTLPVWLFANYFYRHRHRRWQTLIT